MLSTVSCLSYDWWILTISTRDNEEAFVTADTKTKLTKTFLFRNNPTWFSHSLEQNSAVWICAVESRKLVSESGARPIGSCSVTIQPIRARYLLRWRKTTARQDWVPLVFTWNNILILELELMKGVRTATDKWMIYFLYKINIKIVTFTIQSNTQR